MKTQLVKLGTEIHRKRKQRNNTRYMPLFKHGNQRKGETEMNCQQR